MQPAATLSDDGCPGLNGTRYDSVIKLEAQSNTRSFAQLCDVNYPENPANPLLLDLLAGWAQTLKDCMALCAQYNREVQQLQIAASSYIGTVREGYCRAVTIQKIRKFDCLTSALRKHFETM